MSIVRCEYCDKNIDTDFNLEHFNEKGLCMKKEEAIVLKLNKLAEDISSGNIQLDPETHKEQIVKAIL